MEDLVADEALDASGLTCPLPLLKAKQALNRLESGCILQITCTDPGSVRDFDMFCRQSGNQLLSSKEGSGTFQYWLRKV